MESVRSYERSLARSRASRTRHDRPEVFTLHGRAWDLLDDVFAPPFSPSTGVAMELLGLTGTGRPPAGSFLEIGCGTGVIAVSAALAGCDRVLATDINQHAVRNTELNAARHGVAGRVRALRSDLFAGIPATARFDTVYWHSNFVLAPSDYHHRDVHEQAYVDPGYEAHLRYLRQAPDHLTEGGRVLLHFSSRGDLALLRRSVADDGRELRTVASATVREDTENVEYMLLELITAAS
ncbi:class I SAM-dependent methyltransferase [Streptomyces sp. TRM72054]|uniref:50S ribosomal protein L11 methyltransferase n=1 Tax=Streptomyces sp. TRM72054 TaxID=2870562 RepID=UPI001C8BF35B|nr:class I SAM-dependent methyltransferase [Streptomyces sp. TRM72054]MBX9396641.1 class I SAM-dependent methyltransferase [Streptomyces sp. TRM72054]